MGSYGKFATFKAEVLNDLVERERVDTVIEFGCGDGAQLSLARYPSYVGLDVSQAAIARVTARFPDDPTKSFFAYDPDHFVDRHGLFSADLALSLDVIYHLVEDRVFEQYMRHLFGSAKRLVAVYSSDGDTFGATPPHVRHRRFTSWVAEHLPEWTLEAKIDNRYPYSDDYREGSWADFFIFRRREPTT